jgi:SAM-dependent methyltransferase
VSRLETVEALLASEPRARGRVLDAGTGGGYMTAILASLGPSELVSVSVDEAAFAEARERSAVVAGAAATGKLRFLLGDLADPDLLPVETFNLVVADYLLAAVASQRPFREPEVLERLGRLLAPSGLLVVTGMEPFEPARTPEQEAIRAVLRWWAALTFLGDEEMYREFPSWWVAGRLRERGLAVEAPVASAPLVWSMALLQRLAHDGRRRAAASGDPALERFAVKRLAALVRRAARLPGFASGDRKVAWSRDWVVRAWGPA